MYIIINSSIGTTTGTTNKTHTRQSDNWKLWIQFLSSVRIQDAYLRVSQSVRKNHPGILHRVCLQKPFFTQKKPVNGTVKYIK